MSDQAPGTYEFSMRILGNEMFAVKMQVTDKSNRWVVLGTITAIGILSLIGAYGESFVELYRKITQ